MANAVPPFDVLNQNYPNFVSVETVKRLIGGASTILTLRPRSNGSAARTATPALSGCHVR